MDASASRSITDHGGVGIRSRLIQGKFSNVDILFPFFDQMAQLSRIPHAITFIFIIFQTIQSIIISFWPVALFWNIPLEDLHENVNGIFMDITNEYKVVSGITLVFWFMDTLPTFDTFLITFIILLIVSLSIFAWFIGFIMFYLKNLRFFTWGLYLSRFIIECILPILIYPSSALFGASIWLRIDQHDVSYWVYIVPCFLILLLNATLTVIGQRTIFISCCINTSLQSSFNTFFTNLLYAINSVSIILTYFFYTFPSYAYNVFQITHSFILVFLLIYLYRNLPFHHSYSNIYHAVLGSTEIFGSLSSFVLFIVNRDRSIIILIGTVIIFIIISSIGNYFLYKKRYDTICKHLTDNEKELVFENDYTDYFKGLGLLNEKKAITYLHVGFTEICPMFINWTFTKFLTKNLPTVNVTTTLLQIVSFFPTEYHQLNTLFSSLTNRMNLSFNTRFLIYQTYRIKALRQSSNSSDANERLIKLRSLTKQCITSNISFWKMNDPSISIYETLAKEQHRVNSLWIEALRDYPNSSKLRDKYATFLIECMCEFHAGVAMKQKADMIETGTSFAVDASFKSLISSYPAYFQRRILDGKGCILDSSNWKTKSGSSFSTEFTLAISEVVETESTIEYEEKLGRLILNKSKLRFACDTALKKRTHGSYSNLPLLSCFSFIVGIIVFIVLYIYNRDVFYHRKDSVDYISFLGISHFYSRIANFLIITRFVYDQSLLGDTTTVEHAVKVDGFPPYYISFSGDFRVKALNSSYFSRKYFSMMIDKINNLVDYSNDDIYPLVEKLIGRNVQLNHCYNKTVIGPSLVSMKSILSYNYFLIANLVALESISDFYNNDIYCESIENQKSLLIKFDEVLDGFNTFSKEKNDELMVTNNILLIICPIILFTFSYIPYLTAALAYVHHVNKITNILLNIDHSSKEEASKQIRKDVEIEIHSVSEPHLKVTNIVSIMILLFIFALLSSLICFGLLKSANSYCKKLNMLNSWAYYASIRLTSSIDLLAQCWHTILLDKNNSCFFLSREQSLNSLNKALEALIESNQNLLRGDVYKSIYDYDSILGELNFKEKCQIQSLASDFHDTYRCGSADKLLATVRDLVQPIILTPEIYGGRIEGINVFQFVHLLNSHLWIIYESTVDRLSDLSVISYSDLILITTIYFVIGIIASFLVFSGGYILQFSASKSYKAMLAQIKRIPPNLIIADKQLKNFLLNKDKEKDFTTSVSRSVLHNSSDAMLCVSLVGVIEMVNPAVTSTLGFTPEQILGQSVISFFEEQDAEKLVDQMNIIFEGQNGCVYEDHMRCTTDNSTLIPVEITLLGMQSDEISSTQSFVIILKDESELIKKRSDAEEAKAQSENLLYHILPQNVVMRLNRGEKDICFTVPSATIVFIDIVKFSEFTKNLTPQDIMGSLSHIFSSFDLLCNDYPLVLKIKLIGDIYMAAAGLFTEGKEPENHANQAVKFGIDALNSLEDANVKLDASLMVRIGINTGGPIIAGVLGTDKPVFDIIGDTINVASRLQTTDIPGKIQITQSTYQHLKVNEYSIEERGEVFLKGKGQVMTYLVSPYAPFKSENLLNL
ncbi:Adenylate and Guanylate cyclase catalytic domain containing protein [Tritrichomonas foetus]|uniref:Adenylate and Guanylate cyclase catalytic domain containing protein n=1 Tax=Tritrichomonas foetus TaxID=1144522 RepID=A0A1J4JCD8_9EUKA|nr:Adenylate and Guanylate cyclase catalytic domain containing protein [Tritrichomonas foetus]|eukprot:OHS95919.1 Adenylate and Guanylate cyclase catalytic domain containing protein [Tritrichomonas foetus]